ncbi:MAG: M23 family metallopeptidase [Candidatus Heimdallarchaeota archaeon]|nr:M23 family metallopeptidase [Candidatus Heimdallarchaeota archaeon]
MKKGIKILLGVFIPLMIIGAGIGVVKISELIKNRHTATLEPPSIDFPVENIDIIHIIWGYGNQSGDFHNGIDFGCNTSVNIIAWCDMTVVDVTTFYNEDGGHWQTNVFLEYNKRFYFDCAFEPWALNETYVNYQRDAINVNIGDTIQRGEVLGMLLYQGSGTHIHFGMYDQGEAVCAYQYFTEEAKLTFNTLWDKYGWGDDSWYT